MRTFYPLAQDSHPERFIPEILPWLHEAGNPYFDWIFGCPKVARESLAARMRKQAAEFSVSRATLLLDDSQPVGGFVALGGTELARCRVADMVALLKEKTNKESADQRARLEAAQQLFPRVAVEEFYLSKVGVNADWRGNGLGRALVLAYVAAGRTAGFQRFRLDVWAENKPAIQLYLSLGFQVDRKTAGPDDHHLRYLSMTGNCDTLRI